MDFTISLNIIQIISIVLFSVFGYIVINVVFGNWSYKISKPYKWENAVKEGSISSELLKQEKTFDDKVRFYSIWFQLQLANHKGVVGGIAELGVYQGETAKIIHLIAPDRKFLMVDTFNGFDKSDLDFETSKGNKHITDIFSNTSLEKVKDVLGDSDNLIFIKGHFPECLDGFNEIEKYAFVHLDADLYKPTLNALEYFYPKLSPGGTIMVHDYNHNWAGVRNAVDEFCEKNKINFVQIADMQGSIVITK